VSAEISGRRRHLAALLALPWWWSGCTNSLDVPPGPVYQSQPARDDPVFRFAIHPLHNPVQLARSYGPLTQWLNAGLPAGRLLLEASRDYQAYEKKLRGREPHLLLPNPWQTLVAQKAGYHVIATAGDNRDFRGIFLVRRNSPIRSLDDVRGKTLGYPSPTALAAAMMPQYALHQAGVNVRKETRSLYVGSQESAIMNVAQGLVDVGVTWVPPWRLFQASRPELAGELRVLWETPPLINNSVMVRDDLPPDWVQSVQRRLLSLSADNVVGRSVLEPSATSGFFPASDADYALVTDFIRRFETAVRPVEDRS